MAHARAHCALTSLLLAHYCSLGTYGSTASPAQVDRPPRVKGNSAQVPLPAAAAEATTHVTSAPYLLCGLADRLDGFRNEGLGLSIPAFCLARWSCKRLSAARCAAASASAAFAFMSSIITFHTQVRERRSAEAVA